ncbi:hypothetical protein BHE74_00000741 [Ensete ventricosum]|nr:hypothetical protein GW17_00032351 [Ensete ventricosum]RWW90123.1 hypothetical protein BHE74_00000741 [Ensete ventricosum]
MMEVISRTGKAEALTNPHRPYGKNRVSLEEIKRVRAAGGWVCFLILLIVDGRICGDLAVSRSFGDMRFKSKKNEFVPQNSPMLFFLLCRIQFKGDLVTSSPDIYQVALGSDVEFVLLASDGLWDYMKSSDAVSFVRDQLRQHGDVQLACEALARVVLVLLFPDGLLVIGHVSHFRAILIRDNIWLIITFILQDRRSQDNISIVIADLGYLSCTFLF